MGDNRAEGKKISVAAFGFDDLGFKTPTEKLETERHAVTFVSKTQRAISLDSFDCVILPSGIFETISFHDNPYHGTVASIEYDQDLLVSRERQLRNHIISKKTAIFLIRRIDDRLPRGEYQTFDTRDCDLTKRIMNSLEVFREPIPPTPNIAARANEFHQYVKTFGVAETRFSLYHCKHAVLAQSGASTVGFEVSNRLFFLPFHSDLHDINTLKKLVPMLLSAVSDYQQKHELLLPSWLDEFTFNTELSKKIELEEEKKKVFETEQEIERYRRYKGILSTSGDHLVGIVADILSEFFGLALDAKDEKKEDLKLLGPNKEILALLEVKGIKGNVKLEHINQVDTHRERSGHSAEMPGILIINTLMDSPSIQKRAEQSIEQDQVKRAVNMNVCILRTVDLLSYMKLTENLGFQVRRTLFTQKLLQGGGWLRISDSDLVLASQAR